MKQEINKEKLKEIVKSLMLKPSKDVIDGIILDWNELQYNLAILNKINTEGVEPMSHINETPIVDFFRDDVVVNFGISKSEMLSNASQKDSDFVITKKVVK
ncbi:Asp-tRNA(Asn)/Glu-tRNA(Gln) amidotransferase subunit GatC [Mycoplasma crocodyli]|uniref:Asp-trnaasn/glu-trnagln amidotransferase C subunit n=1 Tax=Mycoplasma crocodyli (strain ATCC 51981 / MP145) TaxID=512564 RepID=D5E5U3_MYCCM|nr:Asp-tRNA(Asn)/Glu-tRNA(Gln) amidotransferase subunit GatC [Mycoplasma crocodyli]ADE19413.1 asp-trnaasn/glu-trnagln amidotransferase C subunit [Mycoplasma crocodyli MP145]